MTLGLKTKVNYVLLLKMHTPLSFLMVGDHI